MERSVTIWRPDVCFADLKSRVLGCWPIIGRLSTPWYYYDGLECVSPCLRMYAWAKKYYEEIGACILNEE
ncbi:hypothetical protein ASPCADRAFT_206811 [Aspergillus carbonarius ITEM 5010]|uniref:Uncharacterized protein n=1 Tax=Aspergillus carbonarius (strain ITEM 5010) TaxID=602072 RepID=A0A1R3RQ58_ASPC5|nr:hypothetical protein ASPCADRAFT_206811 [Aspergillus carbonarius ITEM 5010]